MPAAYFLIADITGYTAYLSGSELEHAQDILQGLFEALLAKLSPPLKLAKLEGDALFMYLPDAQIAFGQTVIDAVESLYSVFRGTQERMVMNTSCPCQACRGIPSLDLKFFVHHGEYVARSLAGQEELTGTAVILVHRLMKNTVTEKTGLRAYALFSEAAIQRINLPGLPETFIPHVEVYEHLGAVRLRVYDLHPFWEHTRQQHRDLLTAESADGAVQVHLDMDPLVLWDIMTSPATRGVLVNAKHLDVTGDHHGRIGVGSVYHCHHGGNDISDQMVMDWQPFEYITTVDRIPAFGMQLLVKFCYRLQPAADGGTDMTVYTAPVQTETSWHRPFARLLWGRLREGLLQKTVAVAIPAVAQAIARQRLETSDPNP